MSDEARRAPDRVPTGIELTALDPAFRSDPYPVLARLRAREPVHFDDVIKRWVLTRSADVASVFRNRTMAVDGRKANEGTYMRRFAPSPGGPEPNLLRLDAPDHTRLRSLVNKAFTPRAVERLTPRIREVIDELLAAVVGRDRFDLIAAFAGPLPMIVIAEMLGIDPADRADFKRWSDSIAKQFHPTLTEEQRAEMARDDAELGCYLERVITERRTRPGSDLVSALIAVEEAGDQLNDREIVTLCGLLLAAGNLTTTDLIGNGILTLLRHPDELRKLRADPALIRNAVEEMLRFEPPVVQTARIAMHDMTMGGCPIRRGESVLLSLAAANRDEAGSPDPERFDVTRPNVEHHSFGGGVHFCLGAPLARLEAQLAIGALVEHFPNLRLADEPLEWRAVPSFRGLARLTVLV